MNRRIVPPHVRPTANASSSESPNVPPRGSASPASTASASETTAPSTQPPLTLPATSPSWLTAIAAPGPRGPDPSTSTTRATATRLPARCQRSMSSSNSRTSSIQHAGEGFQRVQRVALHELVDVGERRRHATGEWRVARRHLQWVDPHHAVGDALQSLHLLAQHLGIAAVPPVRQDHDVGAARHAAHAPAVVERGESLAETS